MSEEMGVTAQQEADAFVTARDAFRNILRDRGSEAAKFTLGVVSGDFSLMPEGFAALKAFHDTASPAMRLLFENQVKYDLANPPKRARKPRTKKAPAEGAQAPTAAKPRKR